MSYKFQQIEPTLARGSYRDEYLEHTDWVAEVKYDGDRRIAQFCEEGTRFTGRRVSDINGLLVEKTENLPQLNEAVEHLLGTVLDGEIVHPGVGKRSNEVTKVMGSLPARAAQLQSKTGWLIYRAFDCLLYRGEDLRGKPLEERRQYLVRVLEEWENTFAAASEQCYDDKAEFLHKIWDRGDEGIILKHKRSLYHEKNKWVKVKKEFTEDVVIMGYEDPKALSEKVGSDGLKTITRLKENGWIGAIRGGQYNADGELVEVASVSGMKDSVRAELSPRNVKGKVVDGGAKYIGMVMEIEANEREPSGRFRHPRFSRFRPDKNPEECKLPGVK